MASGTLNATKPEEGTDPLDSFIRQAFGGVSFTPYSMVGGSPVPLVQVLHGLEGSGLNNPQVLGWPLSSPAKQKCEKCSQEFWSTINYRRHVRVHRQPLDGNGKNRELLAAFWDKLSLEQTKEIMSFSGVMLKDIAGIEIITNLTSSLGSAMVLSFPKDSGDAGFELLKIIEAKPSRLPIKSDDLFRILDGASEGTFCAGTPESVEKYIFVGNTAKNSLEFNNLVASTGFLFEQELVKAWFADKEADALRLQNLLMEEEEAGQRRKTAIAAKKKRKKDRKDQKMKESNVDNQVLDAVDSVASDLSSPPDIKSSLPDAPQNKEFPSESSQLKADVDIVSQIDISSLHILENSEASGASNDWQVPKSRSAARSRHNVGQNRPTFKPNLTPKHATPRNQIQQNRSRGWTKTYKDDSDENGSKTPAFKEGTTSQIEEDKCDDVKPPAFKEETVLDVKPPAFKEETMPQTDEDKCDDVKAPAFKEEMTPQIEEDKCDDVKAQAFKEETTPQLEEDKCDDVIIGVIPVTVKSSVSSLAKKNATANLTKMTVGGVDGHDRAMTSENSQSTNTDCDNQGQPLVSSNASVLEGSLPICSDSEKEFMAQGKKEANSAEHVNLDISSPTELPPSVQDDKTAAQVSDIPKSSVVGNADNIQAGGVGVQAKYGKKTDKALNTIPNQKE